MKTISLILISGLVYFLLVIMPAYQECMTYVPPAGYVASDKVQAALAYHGIGFAESDCHGVLRFDRDDQACRLFTVAFLDNYDNNK